MTFVRLEELGLQAHHYIRLHALHSLQYETVTCNQENRVHFEVPKLVFVYFGQKRFGKNIL